MKPPLLQKSKTLPYFICPHGAIQNGELKRTYETRPFTGDCYLLVGSALCGGSIAGVPDKNLFDVMDTLSKQSLDLNDKLTISTVFSGTRQNPDLRGSITGLGVDNFTPEHFIAGILEGTVNELYQMYQEIEPLLSKKPTILVGSGNGIRRSAVWQRLFSKAFGMEVRIPLHLEEAAYGAALFALVSIGVYPSIEAAQGIIQYQPM